MTWLESLQNLVDIDLGDISILDITYVNVKSEGTDPPIEVDEDDGLTVDLASIDESRRAEALEHVMTNYEEGGEIFKVPTYEEKKAIEATDTSRIEETLEFFRPIISNRHHRILEAALYLREAWEQDRDVPSKKRDIVEKYGPDGRYIANLCTAGYFDEGRYFRELYSEMQEEDDWKEGDFRDVFEEIIKNQPFTVFVSRAQSADDVVIEVRAKLRKYERYGVDVNFIDVRGIGEDNRETIADALERLEEDIEGLEYDDNLSGGMSLVRIYPESVTELGDTTLQEFM